MARYGQRLCAAKLLHPIFFQSNDPGVTTRRMFQQECRFLNDMKHPHIVEYLGTSHDPHSGLLVLLMELCDESLTHFLEHSQQPLAFHIEVNLCHDIAQALAYIHSKEIIHRDLSGNNVLLIAGKAKITDFKMSKLLDADRHMTSRTMCPKTLAYMPPEALKKPPVYSKKMDCFSFGVLQIQIMTRQFPDPGPAMQVVEDSQSPSCTTNKPVFDRERRKSHIDLIDPTHTLLQTALNCLSYLEKDRPSAQDLYQQLVAVKEAPRYQLQTLQQELRTKDQQLQDSQRHVHTLQQEIQDSQRQIQQLTHNVEELTQQLQTMQKPRARPKKTVVQQKEIRGMSWQKESKAPNKMHRGSAVSDSNMAYFSSSMSDRVHSYNSATREWCRLPDTPYPDDFNLVVVQHMLTIVGGEILTLMGEGREKKWLHYFPEMLTWRNSTAAVCSGHSLIVAGGAHDRYILSTVEVLDTDTYQWSIASPLTLPFAGAQLSICGERLYVVGGSNLCGRTQSVLSCSVPELLRSCQPARKLREAPAKKSTIWRHVANALYYDSSCVTLCGQLVAVGGGKITVYNERTDSWEAMTDTQTAREQALVAAVNEKMMVVGGMVESSARGWTETDLVDILC